ncbi:hypothetical protein [Lacisediminihabitans profunda]|uniref:Uncharacterized protein n=1 Tax=Lacisediminihabitans profunda TaxID=2594790 RepID=A0A5C8US75_9MICO|nr:hypothetical protein [Lacisediminihabitans profunda]TXN31434.1 hypothetical protein FVP33_07760 [Lacisediminihabitans profunda]
MPEEQPPVGAFPREGWDADARRPAPQDDASATPDPSSTPPVAGRRSQEPGQESASPQNDYPTPARPQVPSYDGPSFRSRSISAVPESPAASSAVPGSEGDTAGADGDTPVDQTPPSSYRVRDFSPDGRRSSFPAATSWSAPVAPGATPVELDYHTLGALPSSLASSPPPVPDPAPRYEAAPERTMTRREMRALEQSGALRPVEDAPSREHSEAPRLRERIRNTAPEGIDPIEAQPTAAPVSATPPVSAAPPVTEPPILVEPPQQPTVYVASPSFAEQPSLHLEAPADDHVVEATIEPESSAGNWFDAIADEQAADDAPAVAHDAPVPADAPRSFADSPASFKFEELLFNAPVADVPEPFVAQLEPEPLLEAPEPAAPVEQTPAPAAWLAAFPATKAPQIVVPQSAAPAPASPAQAPAAQQPASEARPAEVDTAASYSPPVGHWSTQASIDDDEQVQENTFSRNVGATSGAITTSALVLPSIPTADDILSPLGSTGEILITGSINLPSSMGTTGVHPARYDHSDVDALLEADDREDSDHPDSAPVRAIRAVSTHTSSGAVISAKKPKGDSRLPIVLAVSAAVMAVGVVVLFVVGMIFKIF